MATPLEHWVDEAAQLTRPAKIVWCDGSEAEYQGLSAHAGGWHLIPPQSAHLSRLLSASQPSQRCRAHRASDVYLYPGARRCGTDEQLDGPQEARDNVGKRFDGSMQGRTMYVVPYIMGPVASPYSKVGVDVTDSPYVAASMRIMTRMGNVALERLGSSADFVPGLHSIADLSPDRRFILHFPEERLIWSIGSGYGGNALLGKKCLALRIASAIGRDQGWMAEHMLILGLEDPTGEVTYMAAAFPSARGKTNLSMLVSPLAHLGYEVWTVGDDIAWMHPGADGRMTIHTRWHMMAKPVSSFSTPGTVWPCNPSPYLSSHTVSHRTTS